MNTNEQRYTVRECLEKTLPQGGEWRTLSANSDYLWWHHCPDSNGVYFYAGAMRASCDPLAGHGNVWSRAHIIPRSTAIDLMVAAIECGDHIPDIGKKVEAEPVTEPRSEFERGVRAACDYIASGVKGAPLSRVDACRAMLLGGVAKPDPYAHLPHGGWWGETDDYLFWWPNTREKGQRFTKDGQPHIKLGDNSCDRYYAPYDTTLPKLTRAQAIAIIAAHKAKHEQPAITSSLADIKAGRVRDAKEAFAELDAEIQEQPAHALKVGDRVRHHDNYYGEGVVVDGDYAGKIAVEFPRGKYYCDLVNLELLLPAPAMGPHDDKAKAEQWLADNHADYEIVRHAEPQVGDYWISINGGGEMSLCGPRGIYQRNYGPRYILARKAKDEPVKGGRTFKVHKVMATHLGAGTPTRSEVECKVFSPANDSTIDPALFELVKAISGNARGSRGPRRDAREIVSFARKLLAEMREVRE